MSAQRPAVEVPKLKPSDLFDKRRQRDTARLKAYNKILEQIYTRIRSASQQGQDPWVIYTVPPFLLGLPRIDLEDCIVYLVYILRQQQYDVRYTYPNLLYISWKHHERDYILKNSPIMQAMLPPTKASEPRKGNSSNTGHVRFQDEITVAHQSRGGLGTVAGSHGLAPPRNSLEYQPPTSFLDAIEKPSSVPRRDAIQDLMFF